jgi:hypothetical protein
MVSILLVQFCHFMLGHKHFFMPDTCSINHDPYSPVSTVTRLRICNRKIEVLYSVVTDFYFRHSCPDRFCGPPIHLSSDNGAPPPGAKRTGHDADHSFPHSIERVERLELYLHKKIKIHNGLWCQYFMIMYRELLPGGKKAGA